MLYFHVCDVGSSRRREQSPRLLDPSSDRLIPFIKEAEKSDIDGGADWADAEELDSFLPWSKDYLEYEASVLAEERQSVFSA